LARPFHDGGQGGPVDLADLGAGDVLGTSLARHKLPDERSAPSVGATG